MSHALINHIVSETNLQPDTVKDLLESGWTFVQAKDETTRWESPNAILKY